jgi:hypothetical protein
MRSWPSHRPIDPAAFSRNSFVRHDYAASWLMELAPRLQLIN